MKILIPNATGPTNTGDQAILMGLLGMINKKYPEAKIIIHSSDPEKYYDKNNIKPHLLFWSVIENQNPIPRITRSLQLIIAYLSIKLIPGHPLAGGKLKSILNDYTDADRIIFVGGGYFRTKSGLKQSLYLLSYFWMLLFAIASGKKITVAPTSFGPFAYKWQEKLAVRILKKTEKVFLRCNISYENLRKHGLTNITLSNDTALFLQPQLASPVDGKPVIGFTIRVWDNDIDRQIKFEKEYAKALTLFSKDQECVIQPIIQVTGSVENSIEDDRVPTKRVVEDLKSSGVNVLDTISIRSLEDSLKVYKSIDLLLGMRMHSNILSAIQGKPFVATEYEYKTRSISEDLGMLKYCIKYEDFDGDKAHALLKDVFLNRKEISSMMSEKIRNIQMQLAKIL